MSTKTFVLRYSHATLGSQRSEHKSIRAAKIAANKQTWGYAYPHIDDAETGVCVVGSAREQRRKGGRLVWIWPEE